MLLSKEISSTNLLKFYYMRAKTIGRDIRAAVESNIDDALVKAAEADKIFAKNDPNVFEKFPVLGIPFSVKESYAMKGFDTTQGFPTRINHPSDFTAPLVQEVINKGGIAFARTNFPQALMTVESENDIYGVCCNPFNKDRVVGGSSGGEGALVGSLCSPFGIGSDIGGSIRNPAHNNGVFGFKPTTGRICHYGHLDLSPYFDAHAHQQYIKVTMGPLCKSADDVDIIMSIIGQEKLNNGLDGNIPPTNWNESKVKIDKSKTKVGYFSEMKEIIGSSRLTKKAISSVVASLEKSGVECVEFTVPEYTKWMAPLLLQIFVSDGNSEGIFDTASHGIKIIQSYEDMVLALKLPIWFRKFLVLILTLLSKITKKISFRFIMMLYGTIQLQPDNLFKDVAKQVELSIGFLREMNEQKITHLICPTFPVAAPEHRKIKGIILGAFWTGLFNFIGNPSCVVPIGTIESLSKLSNLCSKDKSNPYLNRIPKPDKQGLYFDEYKDDVNDFITELFDKEC
jgi:fatty acid amide hydrolase